MLSSSPLANEEYNDTEVWLPFSGTHDDRYMMYKKNFEHLLRPELGARAVEDLSKRAFKSMVVQFGSPDTMRSQVWDPLLNANLLDLKNYISLFHDYLFIQITRAIPNEHLYLRLLAFKRVVLNQWLTIGK